MRNVLRRAHRLLASFGLNPVVFARSVRRVPRFAADYFRFRRQLLRCEHHFPVAGIRPCLHDRSVLAGVTSGHYFHQDLYVAQRIYESAPERHVDVGSRIDGFVAHVASFRHIEVIDIRDVRCAPRNMTFRQADVASGTFGLVDYCDSLSCLSALEHFGLGRYGDRLDCNGHLKGWRNLHRMLKRGGTLFFSVPIGPQRIEFDAHRVFSLRTLLDMIDGYYSILRFSYVNDAGDLVEDALLDDAAIATNFSCDFGCGIFELRKL